MSKAAPNCAKLHGKLHGDLHGQLLVDTVNRAFYDAIELSSGDIGQ